jgi:hypothetical protein
MLGEEFVSSTSKMVVSLVLLLLILKLECSNAKHPCGRKSRLEWGNRTSQASLSGMCLAPAGAAVRHAGPTGAPRHGTLTKLTTLHTDHDSRWPKSCIALCVIAPAYRNTPSLRSAS